MNRSSWWRSLFMAVVILFAVVYALPNVYGEDPAVQVMALSGATLNDATKAAVVQALQQSHVLYKDVFFQNQTLIVRFDNQENELKAKALLQETLGSSYIVALNLFPRTPAFLRHLGASPMKLGLDLRGGVHFLLQVDVDHSLNERLAGEMHGMARALHDAHIRYTGVNRASDKEVMIFFRDRESLDDAKRFMAHAYPDFLWDIREDRSSLALSGTLNIAAVRKARFETLEQAMNTLRHRVNELGVSEAVVQAQGKDRVSVDLPGVQDTAEAKNILGKTATLEFHLVETSVDPNTAEQSGVLPPDTRVFMDQGRPILLKNQIVLHGSSIVSAMAGMGEDGRPNVSIRLGGAGEGVFTETTAQNIGKPLAVLYVEVQSTPAIENGKSVIRYQTIRRIISVATIQTALGSNFQITGLKDMAEAKTLALLLRAGALPAPVTIIEEREIGPSLGEQNIQMGVLSVKVGMALVMAFMALYYGILGVIADLALLINLSLIVALLSLLGATLTLPGIAGIVLTVGMAVDANVLIFERIREELRRGVSMANSIYLGYERAFITIFDANMTTLIVMLILFSLGAGVIKGIAITVTVGVLTSLFSAMFVTRAMVGSWYQRK